MAYVIKTCEGCGNEFENKPGKNGKVYHAKRHCTRQCWLKRHNQVGASHAKRGATVAAQTWRSRRGESHGGNAYVKEDQRHQHRVVAERLLDRPLTSSEVVHHEDFDRKNNDPRNLIIFKDQSAHMKHHQRCLSKNQTCQCDCVRLGELMGGDV